MKSILIKIIIALIVIFGAVVVAEKLMINNEKLVVTDAENNEIKQEIVKCKPEKEQYNALVVGNSITIERDGIGMAASDQYHDYYYLIKSRLEQNYKKVNMNRISAIHWEENRTIKSRTDWINENLTSEKISNLDLVIFQLGDNCVPTETFENDVTELVNHVKQYSPNAKMLLVGMWFINEERLAMMPNIAKNLGMEFIDISDLVVDENKSYIGAEVTTIDGNKNTISTIEEAFHPNDEGMKKIANRIIEKLEL